MSAGELQFRTAAFGGFQKQDVLDFIDSRSREQQEKLEALKRELEEGAKARAELEEELAAAKDRVECLAAEGEALSAQQKQAQEQAEALRAELEQTRARAEAAERGLADAQARLAKAEPAAAAYESVKDRTAGMEPNRWRLRRPSGSKRCGSRWSTGWAGSRTSTTACGPAWTPPCPMRAGNWSRYAVCWTASRRSWSGRTRRWKASPRPAGRNWVPGRPARCLWTLNKERQRAVAGGRPPQRERRTIGAQGDCLTDGKNGRPQAARFLYVAARRVHSIRLRYCPV